MKARKTLVAVFCGIVFWGSVQAQSSGRAVSVYPKMETALRMVSDSEEGVGFSNRLGGIDRVDVLVDPQEFTLLSVQDYVFTNKIGFPMLPVRVELMDVPYGATPRVVYGKTAYKDIDLAKAGYPYPLYPVQPQVSKSDEKAPGFAYEAEAYRSDGFFAGGSQELVEVTVLGELRATRIAKVVVKPVQYNAATHTLRIYTALDFEIVYDHADWDATYAGKERYASPAFGLLRNELVNPIGAKSVVVAKPMRYVIVADPMFKDSLQRFVEWKTRFGYEVVQAYTDQPEVGNTAESIRGYLKGLYDNATESEPAPSYVLFVGDLAQIPTQTYGKGMFANGQKHYSDLYLCEYTGDHLPEVHYGRMSASTVEELMPQIEKTIHMESLTPERVAFLDTCVAIAGSDDGRFDYSHLIPTINYICEYYMKDTMQRYVYKYLYPESSNKSEDIVRHFSDGLSIILYTAHGEETGWSDPRVSVSDVNTMTNKDKYPLAIGNCCLTGRFDVRNCYAESLLRKRDAGAVVYIGASDVTYFNQDVYWAIGYTNRLASGVVQTYEKTELGAFDALNHTHGEAYGDWAITAHEIVYAGNMAIQRANQGLEDYYWEVYHVFGDPSYMPYVHRVEYPQVEFPQSLMVGDVSMDVNTVPYARVTLSKGNVILGFAMADRNGFARLDLTGLDSAFTANLTVAAQNYLPFHKELKVAAHGGRYLVISGQEITDTAGNEVESGLYAETYNLRYTLRNVGQVDINKVEVRLVSKDEYLSVENGSHTFSQTLQSGEEVLLDQVFTIKVDKDVPDGHIVRWAIEMVMDDDVDSLLSREGKLFVEAPEIKVTDFSIDDSEGIRPNGVIDNGETVKAEVTFSNLSAIDAEEVKMQVSSQASYLKFPDKVFDLGGLAGNESKTVVFEYSAADAGMHHVLYDIDFIFDIKGRKCTAQVQSYIEPIVETFETGDFSFVDWDTASDWEVDRSKAHRGVYSAASARIADREQSSLSIGVDVAIDDRVGFYLMTSSEMIKEAMGDFLDFYIDGERVGRWGGIDTAWRYAEYPVAAGKHTLTWTYIKDASESKGEDRVWLDDIRLPIGTRILGNVANEGSVQMQARSLMQVVRSAFGELEVRFHRDVPVSGNLYVVDAMGRRVSTLASGLRLDAGDSILSFPLADLPQGVYILVFEDGVGNRCTTKFVLAV